jgi:hypothetical protein
MLASKSALTKFFVFGIRALHGFAISFFVGGFVTR